MSFMARHRSQRAATAEYCATAGPIVATSTAINSIPECRKLLVIRAVSFFLKSWLDQY